MRPPNVGTPLKKPQVGAILPDLSLPAASGSRVPLRSGNETLVIFRSHGADCRPCQSFIGELRGIDDEFRVWEARLIVLHMEADERLPMEAADLLVADRFGQIFYVAHGGPDHHLPQNRELTEWLKHLGTLCPE